MSHFIAFDTKYKYKLHLQTNILQLQPEKFNNVYIGS